MTALAIAAAFLIPFVVIAGLVLAGHWRRVREPESKTATKRMRVTINYRATMDQTPPPKGLSPERLKARTELIEANARRIKAQAARKNTKRFAMSVARGRSCFGRMLRGRRNDRSYPNATIGRV